MTSTPPINRALLKYCGKLDSHIIAALTQNPDPNHPLVWRGAEGLHGPLILCMAQSFHPAMEFVETS